VAIVPVTLWRISVPFRTALYLGVSTFAASQVWAHAAYAEDSHFAVDPVADGVLTGAGAGFSTLLGLVLSTGEIKPQAPGSVDDLLSIDRIAVTQTIDKNAGTYSNIGLGAAIAYAVADPILSGFRSGKDALIVDAVIYAESASLTLTLTDLNKIAVRRPRPLAYIDCSSSSGTTTGVSCSSTDLSLSFWSGHSATVAAVGATATYLAFVRSPHTARPWITLAASTLLTAFVGYERVRAGEHFPTDVIAGAMAGAAIGTLVPHLHRLHEEAPSLWIGVSPEREGAGLTVGGVF
jgi:undecaprenyl-diphosphatase